MKETQELKARAGHLAKRTAKDWSSRDVATYASSIAFYFFMSMIPVLIIIIQVITRLGLSQRENSLRSLQKDNGHDLHLGAGAPVGRIKGNDGTSLRSQQSL